MKIAGCPIIGVVNSYGVNLRSPESRRAESLNAVLTTALVSDEGRNLQNRRPHSAFRQAPHANSPQCSSPLLRTTSISLCGEHRMLHSCPSLKSKSPKRSEKSGCLCLRSLLCDHFSGPARDRLLSLSYDGVRIGEVAADAIRNPRTVMDDSDGAKLPGMNSRGGSDCNWGSPLRDPSGVYRDN